MGFLFHLKLCEASRVSCEVIDITIPNLGKFNLRQLPDRGAELAFLYVGASSLVSTTLSYTGLSTCMNFTLFGGKNSGTNHSPSLKTILLW